MLPWEIVTKLGSFGRRCWCIEIGWFWVLELNQEWWWCEVDLESILQMHWGQSSQLIAYVILCIRGSVSYFPKWLFKLLANMTCSIPVVKFLQIFLMFIHFSICMYLSGDGIDLRSLNKPKIPISNIVCRSETLPSSILTKRVSN